MSIHPHYCSVLVEILHQDVSAAYRLYKGLLSVE